MKKIKIPWRLFKGKAKKSRMGQIGSKSPNNFETHAPLF